MTFPIESMMRALNRPFNYGQNLFFLLSNPAKVYAGDSSHLVLRPQRANGCFERQYPVWAGQLVERYAESKG